jgi:hypothetical protein
MDPFRTPEARPRLYPFKQQEMIEISKASLLDLISSFDFDHIFIPKQSASDSNEDTVGFLEVIGDALTSELIKHSPPKRPLANSLHPTCLKHPLLPRP